MAQTKVATVIRIATYTQIHEGLETGMNGQTSQKIEIYRIIKRLEYFTKKN